MTGKYLANHNGETLLTACSQVWRTSTFKLDAGLISKLFDILMEECEPVIPVVQDALITTNLQLLTKPEIAMLAGNGGISFGMEEEDGPLFRKYSHRSCIFRTELINTCSVYSVAIIYHSEKDDKVIEELAERIISRSADLAKRMGLYHTFLYSNYAAIDQDVFAGFSPKHQQRLREVHRLYDPLGEYAALHTNSFWS